MAEDIDRVPRDIRIDLLPERLDDEEADEQHKCRAEFLALADLAFLGGVLALLRCRLLGLVAIGKALQGKSEARLTAREPLLSTAKPAGQWISFHTFH